jgi:hypothetical protein
VGQVLGGVVALALGKIIVEATIDIVRSKEIMIVIDFLDVFIFSFSFNFKIKQMRVCPLINFLFHALLTILMPR